MRSEYFHSFPMFFFSTLQKEKANRIYGDFRERKYENDEEKVIIIKTDLTFLVFLSVPNHVRAAAKFFESKWKKWNDCGEYDEPTYLKVQEHWFDSSKSNWIGVSLEDEFEDKNLTRAQTSDCGTIWILNRIEPPCALNRDEEIAWTEEMEGKSIARGTEHKMKKNFHSTNWIKFSILQSILMFEVGRVQLKIFGSYLKLSPIWPGKLPWGKLNFNSFNSKLLLCFRCAMYVRELCSCWKPRNENCCVLNKINKTIFKFSAKSRAWQTWNWSGERNSNSLDNCSNCIASHCK